MSFNTDPDAAHRALMDSTYRWMKYVYDFTRPTFLLGRNRLLRRLAAGNPRSVLEIGMGTGRNLKKLAGMLPHAKLFGSDISREMLVYARRGFPRAGLTNRIVAIEANGVPHGEALQGVKSFDAVFFSYSLSMIPNWQEVLRDASLLVDQERGQLLLVDFGGFSKWPAPLARIFHRSMGAFHVTARREIANFLLHDEAFRGWHNESFSFGGDWAVMHVLSRHKPVP